MSENRATEHLKYCDMETQKSGEGSVNKKFDVFICHRGPDTKCNLAYSIYYLLQERAVEAFLDREELQSGERFPEAIEKAIACSKVDVCILSSGFAESVWCLKELVMMLHKFELGKSTLIPIFYDVRPAEVKYVKGAFGQAFENLQSKDRNSSKDIEQWRHALGKIGGISGYQGQCELSMTIVKRICEVLDIGCMDTPKNVITRKNELHSMIHDIIRCRNNGLGVTSMEISGIGGIGKTTFAKELYNQIYSKYDRYCFIEDVNGLIEKHGVDEVHRQILSKLFRDHQRYLTEGKKLLQKRLHNAEILVVIDNIHSKIPLSTLFIEDDVFLNPRSTIIVTSREEGVLKYDSRVKGYCQNLISLKVEKLNFDTSKEIFCHHAFGGISNVNNEFKEMIEKIVKKCDGMPLALTLLGTHVYQQDIMFWKRLWSSMKDCLHSDVKQILKFSYDNLRTDLEKCLFLDIATFFCWEKEDILLEIRRQSDDEHGELEFQYALGMLKRNFLIDVSNDGILQMHDVLVDLGRSIVKDENLCPGRRSRVWSPSDVRRMLCDEQGTKKVKALTLVSDGSPVLNEGQYPWFVDVFSELSSLEILILHGHCIEGDFSKLSKRLLWLRWTDFPYQEIPLKLCIKHLRVLHVTGENLIRLWAHPSQEAPSKLRQLIIRHCIKLERLPETIGRLRHLSSINLDECKSLKFIPESFGQLQGLKHFKLQGCHALERLPETLGELTSLRTLSMSKCLAVVSLPESIGQLKALENLCLLECKALKQLPESFGDLRNLNYLNMFDCDAMVLLPESFGKLLQLHRLEIVCCSALERLPQSFQCLTSLCNVIVLECGKIRISPEQVQGLQLVGEGRWDLSTHFDDNKEAADSWFDGIGKAEHPNFDFWKNYSIWHSQVPQPHNFRWLLREVVQDIQMKRKRYLDSIASQESLKFTAIDFIKAAGNMTFPCKVTFLRLYGFWNLRELPQFVGNNRYIRQLHLSHCYRLQKLPESLGSLPCLGDLSLHWCCNLQELPDTIGSLPTLTTLTVVGCLALKRFPSSLQNLSCLKELHVEHCWMVEVIHIQGLLNLTHLTVLGCGNLKSIVGISDLRKLEFLEIQGCMNLKSIVELSNITVGDFDAFRVLSNFTATGCYQLRFSEDHVERLPPNFRVHCYKHNHREGDTDLVAKTSPLFFAALKERLRHVLDSSPDKPSFFIHELAQHAHVPSLPFRAHAKAVCCVSSVYADDFPDHIPLPMTDFQFSKIEEIHFSDIPDDIPLPMTYFRICGGRPGFPIGHVRRFDFGEEIHVHVGDFTKNYFRQHIERGDFDLNVDVKKDISLCGVPCRVPYPSYEASVKEGCIIFLNGGGREQSERWASEICNIFVSELRKQRLMSRAWTELPSQLRIHDFSALDIAGCQITKISRHCNTCITEEETGLTWKIRRCIFMDDHSLLLQQPKNSKHSFLAYPGVDRDLEEKVANLYEMSISILAKGKVVHSRKLQQISPKTEEEIPSPLNTLLQSRGFLSTSETMHRLSLFMIKRLEDKSTRVRFERL